MCIIIIFVAAICQKQEQHFRKTKTDYVQTKKKVNTMYNQPTEKKIQCTVNFKGSLESKKVKTLSTFRFHWTRNGAHNRAYIRPLQRCTDRRK